MTADLETKLAAIERAHDLGVDLLELREWIRKRERSTRLHDKKQALAYAQALLRILEGGP
jgi:hypothetical protein